MSAVSRPKAMPVAEKVDPGTPTSAAVIFWDASANSWFQPSSDAKVFVDYDGKLGSHLQEHSVSGGLRVRF